MSDTECGAQASACRCTQPAKHKGPHACGRDGCKGQWDRINGEIHPVVFPTGETDPARALAQLIGYLFDFEEEDVEA